MFYLVCFTTYELFHSSVLRFLSLNSFLSEEFYVEIYIDCLGFLKDVLTLPLSIDLFMLDVELLTSKLMLLFKGLNVFSCYFCYLIPVCTLALNVLLNSFLLDSWSHRYFLSIDLEICKFYWFAVYYFRLNFYCLVRVFGVMTPHKSFDLSSEL